jgi:hypothetical protein
MAERATRKSVKARFVTLNADRRLEGKVGYAAGYLKGGVQYAPYREIVVDTEKVVAVAARIDGATSIKLLNGDAISIRKSAAETMQLLGIAQ